MLVQVLSKPQLMSVNDISSWLLYVTLCMPAQRNCSPDFFYPLSCLWYFCNVHQNENITIPVLICE